MIEAGNQFRVVLRGYDPAQVDRRLSELGEAAGEAQQQVEDLTAHLRKLEQERDRAEERARSASRPIVQRPASFTHLGERVGQILSLAEEEAEEIRNRGRAELDEERLALVEHAERVRSEADRYAADRRSDADTEAARILEEARRTADGRIDAAERDAAARLQEAEAVYEEQRARAAKAATDFETTLATRRQAAEQEFAEQMADTRRRLEEAEQFLEKARAEAEATTSDAARDARRIVQEAEQQANHIVTEAKTTAARIRSDCQRELAAATQRRDSINAQLANVRQMLATLTGGAATGILTLPSAGDSGDPESSHAGSGDTGSGDTGSGDAGRVVDEWLAHADDGDSATEGPADGVSTSVDDEPSGEIVAFQDAGDSANPDAAEVTAASEDQVAFEDQVASEDTGASKDAGVGTTRGQVSVADGGAGLGNASEHEPTSDKDGQVDEAQKLGFTELAADDTMFLPAVR